MAGELSKKVGEVGEKKALELLRMIGWTEDRVINGIDLPCRKSKKHKLPSSEGGRQNHGIDLLFSYECPYEPDSKKHVLISVKNTISEGNTTRSATKIKTDIADLSSALECYPSAPIRGRQDIIGGVKRSQDVGLIIYLDMNTEYQDQRDSDVANKVLSVDGKKFISVLDSQRFDFLEKCYNYLKVKYSDYELEYYIPHHTPLRQNYISDVMPYTWISGGEIMYSASSTNRAGKTEKTLLIFSEDEFEGDYLPNLLSLAMSVSADWVDAMILFPDFNETKHEATAKACIQGLPKMKNKPIIRCASYSLQNRTT